MAPKKKPKRKYLNFHLARFLTGMYGFGVLGGFRLVQNLMSGNIMNPTAGIPTPNIQRVVQAVLPYVAVRMAGTFIKNTEIATIGRIKIHLL